MRKSMVRAALFKVTLAHILLYLSRPRQAAKHEDVGGRLRAPVPTSEPARYTRQPLNYAQRLMNDIQAHNQRILFRWLKGLVLGWVAFCLLGPFLVSPWENDTPKEAITLTGRYPFQAIAPLTFTQRFEAQNPICRGLYKLTFNADFVRRIVQTRAQLDAQGNFTTVVFDDRYTPGFCRWTAIKGMRGYKVSNTSVSVETNNPHFGESQHVVGVACNWSVRPKYKRFYCGPAAAEGAYIPYIPGKYIFKFNPELKKFIYGI